jgi:hypothetical protein
MNRRIEQSSGKAVAHLKKPIVISGYEDFKRMLKIDEPFVKQNYLINRSTNCRITRMNQYIAVWNGDLFVAIMRIG